MPDVTPLTEGVIPRIMNGEDIEAPILQILGVKKIITAESERIRILISDGQYFNSYAMLSTHLNFLCEEEQLKENTIIRVDKYITSIESKNDVSSFMGLTVLHPGHQVQKIGEPVNLLDAPASSAQKAAPTPTSLPSTSNNIFSFQT
uniref:Replication factor-A protein 1 N-terminal domain-containing protein n=1 Tax=Glossina palpalis gambiensis TaxID=67801 RepID=A0A1B0AMC7_9MUSC